MQLAEAASLRALIWNPKLPTHTYKVRKQRSVFMSNSDEILIYEDQMFFISYMPLCLVRRQ